MRVMISTVAVVLACSGGGKAPPADLVPDQALVVSDAGPPAVLPPGCVDRCTRRNQARAVGADVIAAGCARECARVADLLPDCARSAEVQDRVATCEWMSREAQTTIRDALDASYDQWTGILDATDPDPIARANQDCRDIATMQRQQATELGCPL